MKKKRIIPVLLLREGWLVQSYQFREFKKLGNPKHAVLRFSQWDADELIYLDIKPQKKYNSGRSDVKSAQYENILEVVEDVSKVARMPITVGGGITSLRDIEDRLKVGADKICVNQAAIQKPDFIKRASREFGAQCIVVSIDYISEGNGTFVYSHAEKTARQINLFTWAKEVESKGAGEILINDVLRDGMKVGYNLDVINKVCQSVSIPVIACGGAGSWNDMANVLTNTDADAVAAGNIFHFQDQSVFLARKTLSELGIPVRQPSVNSMY